MNKKKIYTNIIVLFVIILLFESPLSKITGISFLSNIDEIISILIFLLTIIYILKYGIPKKIVNYLIYLILFVLIGIFSTIINSIQIIPAIIEDSINCTKFIMCFIGFKCLSRYYEPTIVISKLQRISCIIIRVLFLFTIVDIIFPSKFFEGNSIRYGIHSVNLFFYHPAAFALAVLGLLAIVTFDNNIIIKNKSSLKYQCLFMICMTLRSKAIGFSCLYLIIWGYNKLKVNKFRIVLISLSIIAVISLGYESIDKYYGEEQSARKRLTTDSIKIANDNFPIGLGYASFASSSAAKYYSPIYTQLGYYNIYGLGYITTSYATDSFWPVIFGQFGYLGIVIYILIILSIFKLCLKKYRENKNNGQALLSILIYLLICSTAATAFFNPMAVPYGIILAIGSERIIDII